MVDFDMREAHYQDTTVALETSRGEVLSTHQCKCHDGLCRSMRLCQARADSKIIRCFCDHHHYDTPCADEIPQTIFPSHKAEYANRKTTRGQVTFASFGT